tara:strand:+ start:62 stop:313 length:252 start_codon:yes stop_codon:yes gene_type:complete
MECKLDLQILSDLDRAVDRSKEITNMVGKLQSAFYTNDEQKIEDYLELTRIYSQYALGELDAVIKRLNDDIPTNVIPFPRQTS